MLFHTAALGMTCGNNLCLIYTRSLALIQNTNNDTHITFIMLAKYGIFCEKKIMAKGVSLEIEYLKVAVCLKQFCLLVPNGLF